MGKDNIQAQRLEPDLLQRRLNHKTRRTIRVVQFNIVALSLVAGIVQLSSASVKPNTFVVVGTSSLFVSILASLIGAALNAAPLGYSAETTPGTLIVNYRRRVRQMSHVLLVSFSSAAFGVVLVLLGTVRATELEPIFPNWAAVLLAPILVVASLAGYRVGQRYQ